MRIVWKSFSSGSFLSLRFYNIEFPLFPFYLLTKLPAALNFLCLLEYAGNGATICKYMRFKQIYCGIQNQINIFSDMFMEWINLFLQLQRKPKMITPHEVFPVCGWAICFSICSLVRNPISSVENFSHLINTLSEMCKHFRIILLKKCLLKTWDLTGTEKISFMVNPRD